MDKQKGHHGHLLHPQLWLWGSSSLATGWSLIIWRISYISKLELLGASAPIFSSASLRSDVIKYCLFCTLSEPLMLVLSPYASANFSCLSQHHMLVQTPHVSLNLSCKAQPFMLVTTSVSIGYQTSPLLLDATKPTRYRWDTNLTNLKNSH